jgi:hypothetical protein
MVSLIEILANSSLPVIFVVAGIGFLLLALAGRIAGQVEIHPDQRKWAVSVGALFILMGVILSFFEDRSGSQTPASESLSNSIADTPVSGPTSPLATESFESEASQEQRGATPTTTPTVEPTPAPTVVSSSPLKPIPLQDTCWMPLVFPNDIAPDKDVEEALAFLDNIEPEAMVTWRRAPWALDGSLQVDLSLRALPGNQEWTHVENEAKVTVQTFNAPEHVNVLKDCAGAAEFRYFTEVPLDREYDQYSAQTSVPNIDFFTLEPGEFEIFSFAFKCKAPGRYAVDLDILYSYAGQADKVRFTPADFICPHSYTVWSHLARLNPDYANTFIWNGVEYVPE